MQLLPLLLLLPCLLLLISGLRDCHGQTYTHLACAACFDSKSFQWPATTTATSPRDGARASERARCREGALPRIESIAAPSCMQCFGCLCCLYWRSASALLTQVQALQYLSDCRRHCRCRRRCRCRHRSVLVPGSLRGITNNYSNTDCDCDCDAAEQASVEVDSKSVSQYIHKQKALGTGSRK